MPEPFIFINTYRVKPGMEEEYRRKFQEVADLVEAREPKMLYFAEHVDEDGSQVSTVQVHADAENMAYHMSLIEEHLREAPKYLDYTSMSIRIYGTPSPELLEGLRQAAGSGVSVTVSPALVSVSRFTPAEVGDR